MKTYLKLQGGYYSVLIGIFTFFALIIGLTDVYPWKLIFYFWFLALVFILTLAIGDYFTKKELYHFIAGKIPRIYARDSSLLSRQLKEKMEEELKREEQVILRQRKRQEQQIQFMNLWVHQMKTPLSVLELLAQKNQLEPAEVLVQTQRLKNGLSMALNEARLGNDFEKDFVLQRVNLKETVQKVINSQKTSFIQQKIYPQLEMPDTLFVISDEKWLQFIIEQLISNSLKYSPETSYLKFRAEETQTAICLKVIDEGIGIPKSDLPRVVQPFYTGENGRKYGEATGMGLYLTHQLAQELQIKMTIESQVDIGTTVTLMFCK